MKNIITILFIAVFSNFAFGESNFTQNPRSKQPTRPFTRQKWTLIEIDGATLEGKTPILQFNEKAKSFSISICNHINGKYELKQSQLKFSKMISTLMACREPLMSNERKFNEAIKKITKFRQTSNSLTFFAGNNPVLEFISERQASLSKQPFEDMKWLLISIGTGKISPQTPPSFLEFDRGEMRFSGFGGCNNLSGGYKTSGLSLEFSPFVMPRMACADPAIDKTDREFSAALRKANRYELGGGTLSLFNETALLLTFVSTKNKLTPTRK